MSLDAIKDEISVQFISVTQDFTPGVNKLVIEYKFAKLDSILKVHSDKTFNSSIQIYDKDNEYVYAKDLPLEQSGKVEWDGFLNEERSERIWFKNGPYVIQIKILGGLESTWDRFLACLGSPIDCIYGELQTTISGYAESTFNINEDRENWEQLTFKKVDPGASFTDYLSQKNMFISDLGLQENENPLEYLNNNLIEFEFLGEVMVMHKRFAYVLKTIKESFNEAEYANLSNSLQISNGFRAHKTTNSGVSRHQLGMAIDINPGSNPMLLSDSQAEIFQYIRIVTGLDMHNKSVTLEQTIAAQDLFKTRVLDNQLTLQKVKDALDAIHNYNKDNNKLNFIKLSQNVIESTIANSSTALKAALTSSTSEKEVVKSLATECLTDISNLKEQVTDALTILNHYKTGLAIDQ